MGLGPEKEQAVQYPLSTPQRTWWFPAVALALVVALTWAPVVAAGVSAASAEQNQADRPLGSSIGDASTGPGDVALKVAGADVPAPRTLAQTVAKRTAPTPRREPAPKPGGVSRPTARASSSAGSPRHSATVAKRRRVRTRSGKASVLTGRATPAKAARIKAPSKTSGSNGSHGNELSQARSILASLIAQHPILAGTTVNIGSTPGGYQAVAYFKSGRIMISPSHRASLRTILRHEIWHVIDWRDNKHIDWGENIPPK